MDKPGKKPTNTPNKYLNEDNKIYNQCYDILTAYYEKRLEEQEKIYQLCIDSKEKVFIKMYRKQQKTNNLVLADKCDELERFAKPHPINIEKVMAELDRLWNLTEGGFHITPYEDSKIDYCRLELFVKRAINGEIN